MNPEFAHSGSLPSQLALGIPCVCLLHPGMTGGLSCLPWIYLSSQDPDSGAQAHTASGFYSHRAVSQHPVLQLLLKSFFCKGITFRTGTHKSLVFSYFVLRPNLRTEFYLCFPPLFSMWAQILDLIVAWPKSLKFEELWIRKVKRYNCFKVSFPWEEAFDSGHRDFNKCLGSLDLRNQEWADFRKEKDDWGTGGDNPHEAVLPAFQSRPTDNVRDNVWDNTARSETSLTLLSGVTLIMSTCDVSSVFKRQCRLFWV